MCARQKMLGIGMMERGWGFDGDEDVYDDEKEGWWWFCYCDNADGNDNYDKGNNDDNNYKDTIMENDDINYDDDNGDNTENTDNDENVDRKLKNGLYTNIIKNSFKS